MKPETAAYVSLLIEAAPALGDLQTAAVAAAFTELPATGGGVRRAPVSFRALPTAWLAKQDGSDVLQWNDAASKRMERAS